MNIYVNIPAKIVAIRYKIQVLEETETANKSFIPNIDVAIDIGIYKMNEKSNAVVLFYFLYIPPTIVAPLLLSPGIIAII